MTDLQDALGQIKERAEKATEGPWAYEPEACGPGGEWYRPARAYAEIGLYGPDGVEGEELTVGGGLTADAEFIAHARTDIPRLVEAIEAVMDTADRYPAPSKWDDPTGEIAWAIEAFGNAIHDALNDKLTEEGETT